MHAPASRALGIRFGFNGLPFVKDEDTDRDAVGCRGFVVCSQSRGQLVQILQMLHARIGRGGHQTCLRCVTQADELESCVWNSFPLKAYLRSPRVSSAIANDASEIILVVTRHAGERELN